MKIKISTYTVYDGWTHRVVGTVAASPTAEQTVAQVKELFPSTVAPMLCPKFDREAQYWDYIDRLRAATDAAFYQTKLLAPIPRGVQ